MTGRPPTSIGTQAEPLIQPQARSTRPATSEPVQPPPPVEAPPAHVYDRWVKPGIDRTVAAALCILLAPVMLAITVAVLVKLGRPVLIRQRRVGRHGEVFGMYKFRTMHPDRRTQPVGTAPHKDRRRTHKSPHDPRHTDLGRFLRRYSLDELPQLLNVVRGDMSLVGPRPELEHIVSGYAAWQHQRHLVKPGITGLWQITDRANGELMVHHTATDLDYVRKLSLSTDLRILLRTIPAAVSKPGS